MSELMREEAPVRERFEVDNDMKAEWVLSKIRRIRADQKKETDELERQMQFYKDQIAAVDKCADEDVAFFESMLTGYFANRMEEGFTKETKTQISYKLPTGKLMIKHQAPEFEKDEAAVIAWAKQNGGQYVKTKESLDWDKLKKTISVVGENAVTKDGEVIPGVKVLEREDKFVVEV